MRSPAARPAVGPFGGDAPAASFQKRYTTCLPSGDQLGNPELPEPVATDRGAAPAASFQKRYTACLPSGDQLGNPELPDPVVSDRAPEPSRATIMIWAG